MIPNDPKVMNAFESARSTAMPGNNGAEISDRGHFKEVNSILQSLYGLVPEFKEVAAALRASNEWTFKLE
jgi:hypothetical protein